MNNYRYTLEKYTGKNSRYTCPACGEKHRFTRYIDTETGQHLAQDVGRCNREVKCGYHYKPKEFFADHSHAAGGETHTPEPRCMPKKENSLLTTPTLAAQSLHTLQEMAATLHDYEQNHLVQYLVGRLGTEAVAGLVARYRIGTHHHWQGSTVFWYINHQQHICSGKVMLYSAATGKRVKQPFPHITWMHSLLDKEGFEKQPCFFGEHLLVNTTLPVCLVESEKTALVAAHYLPQSIWLATGGMAALDVRHAMQVLAGRKLTLFPDAGGYARWQQAAAQLPRCNISPLAEHFAHNPGDDLADLLLCA